jgi:TRAP-type C4-dicarboxylate transport system permease large subunit
MSSLQRFFEFVANMPGTTLVVLVAVLIALLVGGRFLDIVEMVYSGALNKVNTSVSSTMRTGVHEVFDARALARGVWATITGFIVTLIIVVVVAKIATAIYKWGEEE